MWYAVNCPYTPGLQSALLANVVRTYSAPRIHHVRQQGIAVQKIADFFKIPQFFWAANASLAPCSAQKLQISAFLVDSKVQKQPLTTRVATKVLGDGDLCGYIPV